MEISPSPDRVPFPPGQDASGAVTIWFTGLSGSGKSTLSKALASHLDMLAKNCRCPWAGYELIDGDDIRRELCRELGFTKADRDENVRRIGYIAGMLNRHNILAIVAAISPYRQARAEIRRHCARFVEVHVDCSLETLIERDVKGLYKKAQGGEIKCFSGLTDPYETPLEPEIYLNSDTQTEAQSVSILVSRLEELNCLPSFKIRDHGPRNRAAL